ncbi:MAG: type III-A CRISPR-associated protein Cas10/Csm1 [Proteobacteria bacterium]|nr:type III-A CRISPR-associated protein Cas10/Csm1 [Pseudomonadota bacterium]
MIAEFALLSNIGKIICWSDSLFSNDEYLEKGFSWCEKIFIKEKIQSFSELDKFKRLINKVQSIICEKEDNSLYPLISAFLSIRNPKDLKSYPESVVYYQPEQIFTTSIEEKLSQNVFLKILEAIEKEVKTLNKSMNFEGLLIIFEKYLSNIPYKAGKVDISLFRFSAFIAAVTLCAYIYLREKYGESWHEEIESLDRQDSPFLFIYGDISGIQKFIYTISSKGALRSLKGRSFFIELFCEHVINEFIENLNLTRANVITSAGGNFRILAPNVESFVNKIIEVKENLRSYIFKEFKGEIYLNIEWIEAGFNDFNDITNIQRRVREKIERSKNRKWEERLYEILKVESPADSCLTTQCEVCFREDMDLRQIRRGDSYMQVCPVCEGQYKLGEELFEISTGVKPVIYKLKKEPKGDYVKIDKTYYSFRVKEESKMEEDSVVIYKINDFEAQSYENQKAKSIIVGIFRNQKIKELSDASQEFGIDRIAVVRMDVDDLGKIFNVAIDESKRSILRISEISWRINKFFKFTLNEIVSGKVYEPLDILSRGVKERGRNLMIVYSGGDDLFLVGHWLDIVETAFDIRRYFRDYTGNEFLTLSAGISINHEDFPIYQFAKHSESLEKKAKSSGKNSIALFDYRRLSWNEFEKVIERVRFFMEFLVRQRNCLATDVKKMPKTFFYRLLSLARRFNLEGVLIIPKVAYLLSKIKIERSESAKILKLKEILMNSNEQEWKITELATIFILMLMRKGGKENE